ncbi:MAG: hypothetical protein M1816_006830 [Peltula sp. TS41687]|nr:MAG: hypothetical protein M1816_006830 [Peltula sp. TS41687]
MNLWAFRQLRACASWSTSGTTASYHHRMSASALDDSSYPLERLATTSRSLVTFEAELFSSSVYKGQPRKELDEAWEKLVDHPMILADYRTLQAFDGRTTKKPTKGIDDHYYATVEVFHHLHCLDITRKFIWRDHYGHVDTFQDPPEIVWKHVGKLDLTATR